MRAIAVILTAPAIRKLLERDKRFDVRIVEDPDFLASPAVGNFDVVFLHFKNYVPLAHAVDARENLENLVKRGKGLVLLHFACGAFEYGKGRVFHTPLGHDVRAIEMPGVTELIRRGCLWAAGRQP